MNAFRHLKMFPHTLTPSLFRLTIPNSFNYPSLVHFSLEKLHLVVIDVIFKHGTQNQTKFWLRENMVELCQLSFLQTEIASRTLPPHSYSPQKRSWLYFLWCPPFFLHSLQMHLCLNNNLLTDDKWEQHEWWWWSSEQLMGDRNCISAHEIDHEYSVFVWLAYIFNLNFIYKTRNVWLAQGPVILMPKLLPGLNHARQAENSIVASMRCLTIST